MIRIATVGTSNITRSFVSSFALESRVTHTAVYSRHKETGEELASLTDCQKVFTDIRELARFDGIDAVYIASPNSLHFEQSKLFLEHGKHVLCEKPIASSAQEYIELKNLADQKGVIYMEAIIPIYSPSRAELKRLIPQLGRISNVKLDFCQLSSKYDALLTGELPNIFNPEFHGGALMDLGIYCVYAAVDLFGEPKKIYANADLLSTGADGSGVAVFVYDGFSVMLSYSKVGQSYCGSEIVGDRGSIKIGRISEYSDIQLITDGETEQIFGKPSKAQTMANELSAFVDFIEGKGYQDISALTLTVHKCMDWVRKESKINFRKDT